MKKIHDDSPQGNPDENSGIADGDQTQAEPQGDTVVLTDDTQNMEDTPADEGEVSSDDHRGTPAGEHQSHPPAVYQGRNPLLVNVVCYFVMGIVSLSMRLFGINYSDSGTPVFDEKHYVPQAQQMLNIAGFVEENPGYGLVVHPPLGKWLLASTEFIFGYNPMGWRMGAIISGVAIVLLVAGAVHKLTKSLTLSIAAAILMNIEGVVFGMSRIGMLDVFLALFITIMLYCVASDITRDNKNTPWHRRWWLLGAGVAGGCAMAVKLSGVYYPALAGVSLVATVLITSRSVRETLKALVMGLVFFLITPLMVFITTWLPWFSSETSVYRHLAEAGRIEHKLPDMINNLLPDSVQSFMSYQLGVMKFHTGLKSGEGFDNVHPWESKPDQWLTGDRPMLFYTHQTDTPAVFGEGNGTEKIYLLANPAVWYLLVPTVIIGVITLILRKGNHPAWWVTLAGITVGIAPWFITYDRQQYLFYVSSFSMFLVMSIILSIMSITDLVGKVAKIEDTTKIRNIILGVYITVALCVFIIYIPWYYGVSVSDGIHDMLTIKNSWEPLEKK